MATSTPSFTGALDANGKFAGWGTLRYDEEGTVYEGDFSDGQFHGSGTLIFANGSRYGAQWNRGVEVPGTGALVFEDALVYNPTQRASVGGSTLPPGGGVGGAGAAADSEAAASGGAAPLEWGYLEGYDRRFWSEHVAGTRAAIAHALRTTRVQTGASSDTAVPLGKEQSRASGGPGNDSAS